MKMETLQNELQQLVAEKQDLCREILLVRAREYVYDRSIQSLEQPDNLSRFTSSGNKRKRAGPLGN